MCRKTRTAAGARCRSLLCCALSSLKTRACDEECKTLRFGRLSLLCLTSWLLKSPNTRTAQQPSETSPTPLLLVLFAPPQGGGEQTWDVCGRAGRNRTGFSVERRQKGPHCGRVLPREILLWECNNRAHEHHSGQVKKARCENGTWAEREVFFYRTGARLPCCRMIVGHVRATEHCVLRR